MAVKKMFLVLLLPAFSFAYDGNAIRTTYGDVRGVEISVLGRRVNVYWGIRYATIPVRFKPPQKMEPWEGILEAVSPPPSCPEVPFEWDIPLIPPVTTPFKEDCLFLNIWVPQDCSTTLGKVQKLTTMVWLHGGALEWGSSTVPTYNGQVLAASQCVIVASINYRLGPLGFLSLGNDLAPGNLGLLDQNLALKWIHDNADNFGGSRDLITLFGESAGSMSIAAHMASPLSRDLFSRAILQSGPATFSWPNQKISQNKKVAQKLAGFVGCPADNDVAMIQCLSRVDSVQLGQAMLNRNNSMVDKFTFVADGYFLQEMIGDLYLQGKVREKPVLVGTTKNDGHFLLSLTLTKNQIDTTSRPQIDRNLFLKFLGNVALPLFGGLSDDPLIMKLVEYVYLTSLLPNQRDDYLTALANVFHDLTFSCPSYTTVNPFMDKSDVFMYSFDHRPSKTTFPAWIEVGHTTEIDFVFGRPLDKGEDFTDEERELSKAMMTVWSNFAKYGDPNGKTNDLPVEWPSLNNVTYSYASLNVPNLVTINQGLRYRECTFWDDVSKILAEKVRKHSFTKSHDEL